MEDLVQSYYGIYGCDVIEENFYYLDQKRYRVVDELDYIIEDVILEEGYELDEGVKNFIKQQVRTRIINPYASRHGIHSAPGWVKTNRRDKIKKPVIKHMISRIIGGSAKKEEPTPQSSYGNPVLPSPSANKKKYESEKKERQGRPQNPRYSRSTVIVRQMEEDYNEIIEEERRARVRGIGKIPGSAQRAQAIADRRREAELRIKERKDKFRAEQEIAAAARSDPEGQRRAALRRTLATRMDRAASRLGLDEAWNRRSGVIR